MFLMGIFSLQSCKTAELATVEKVNIDRYSGTWYEIYRLPNRFEKNLNCVTANYEVLESGKIQVTNKGFKNDKKFKDIRGKAWVSDPVVQGEIKVQFFWPFSGDYYIMALDNEYQHALVGSPTRDYLWILSREPRLDEKIVGELKAYAEGRGFPVEQLEKIEHDCDN